MQKNLHEYRAKLYTAVIADTLDSLGYHNQVLTPGILPLDPTMKLCGFARVGLYMPIYHDDENIKVYEHEIALVDNLKENEVVVLCCHGNQKIAPWGELLSTRSAYLKAAGCLTDGCVRDTDMIREMKFPVFSKGANPVDTKFRGKMMMADVPGEIGDVRVESGDLIFGDNDGVVVVPSSILNEIISKALEKVDSENTVRDEIKKGNKLTDIFAKYGIL
jgi:regulator of RNase E activity RraA